MADSSSASTTLLALTLEPLNCTPSPTNSALFCCTFGVSSPCAASCAQPSCHTASPCRTRAHAHHRPSAAQPLAKVLQHPGKAEQQRYAEASTTTELLGAAQQHGTVEHIQRHILLDILDNAQEGRTHEPPKPPSCRVDATTRWHGTCGGFGFRRNACISATACVSVVPCLPPSGEHLGSSRSSEAGCAERLPEHCPSRPEVEAKKCSESNTPHYVASCVATGLWT